MLRECPWRAPLQLVSDALGVLVRSLSHRRPKTCILLAGRCGMSGLPASFCCIWDIKILQGQRKGVCRHLGPGCAQDRSYSSCQGVQDIRSVPGCPLHLPHPRRHRRCRQLLMERRLRGARVPSATVVRALPTKRHWEISISMLTFMPSRWHCSSVICVHTRNTTPRRSIESRVLFWRSRLQLDALSAEVLPGGVTCEAALPIYVEHIHRAEYCHPHLIYGIEQGLLVFACDPLSGMPPGAYIKQVADDIVTVGIISLSP